MVADFVLRNSERGYSGLLCTRLDASYVAGHPEAVITRIRASTFMSTRRDGRDLARSRTFGDEVLERAAKVGPALLGRRDSAGLATTGRKEIVIEADDTDLLLVDTCL